MKVWRGKPVTPEYFYDTILCSIDTSHRKHTIKYNTHISPPPRCMLLRSQTQIDKYGVCIKIRKFLFKKVNTYVQGKKFFFVI